MSAQAAHNKSHVKIQIKPEGTRQRSWSTAALCYMLLFLVSGCASYGLVQNKPKNDTDTTLPYSLQTWANSKLAEDFIFFLTFSGGGTRAAALAYGILQELRDTPIVREGKQERLLDKVTHISSVSGGSFTAAYYGLFADIPQPQLKLFLNKIPTSFSLTNDQVDTLVTSARKMLRANPEFQQLLTDLARP